MQNIPQNIIEKIQKLINLREGAEAVNSLHEAENAGARLQEMLMKYNLSLDDIAKAGIGHKSEIKFFDGIVDLGHLMAKSESFWITKLYGAIADNNLCRCNIYQTYIRILGREEQVQLVLYIAEQMISKCRIAAKESFKTYDGLEKWGTYRRGFLDGATYGIRQRLQEEREKMQRDTNPLGVMIISREDELNTYERWGTLDPAVIERKKKEIEDMNRRYQEEEQKHQEFLATLSPKERKKYEPKASRAKIRYRKGPRGLSSNDGWIQGEKAGKNMNINKGLN